MCVFDFILTNEMIAFQLFLPDLKTKTIILLQLVEVSNQILKIKL